MIRFESSVVTVQEQRDYREYLSQLDSIELIQLLKETVVLNEIDEVNMRYDSDIVIRLDFIESAIRRRMTKR